MLGIVAILVGFAAMRFTRYRQGPLEWLLRSWSFGRLQPLPIAAALRRAV